MKVTKRGYGSFVPYLNTWFNQISNFFKIMYNYYIWKGGQMFVYLS